jgi:hormone-sensitive lipase
VSVDYCLAPEYPFPKAVNDIWQVYYWLVEYGEMYLGIKADKIVVCGDSAGGNLAAALTTMAVQRGFRVPDGLMMAYPALVLERSNFTPSLLLALDDPILPIAFLNMCLESYAEGPTPTGHEYLSPGNASLDTLSRFPKTRIMIASNDPLRDMSIEFALKLAKVGVDVKLKEYKLLPHGFLNLDNPFLGMREESMETIKQGSTWLNEFLEH